MNYERITEHSYFDSARSTHIYRYTLASRYIDGYDTVLDAACGIGYGRKIINFKNYYGVDKEYLFKNIIQADLNTWQPDFGFDVFISFETLEHLENYKNLLQIGKQANRLMIISVPIVPSKDTNPYHLHDFTKEEMYGLLEDNQWKTAYYEEPDEETGIWILKRLGTI